MHLNKYILLFLFILIGAISIIFVKNYQFNDSQNTNNNLLTPTPSILLKNWETFYDPDWRFLIQFPTKPFHQTLTTNSSMIYDSYQINMENGTSYLIGINETPFDVSKGPETILKGSLKAMVGTIISSNFIDINGNKALDYEIISRGITSKGRMILENNTLFELTDSFKSNISDDLGYNKFIGSFQILTQDKLNSNELTKDEYSQIYKEGISYLDLYPLLICPDTVTYYSWKVKIYKTNPQLNPGEFSPRSNSIMRQTSYPYWVCGVVYLKSYTNQLSQILQNNGNPISPNISNNTDFKNIKDDVIHLARYLNIIPTGASAQCVDGTYSFSQDKKNTCSGHSGVALSL